MMIENAEKHDLSRKIYLSHAQDCDRWQDIVRQDTVWQDIVITLKLK